MARQKKAKNQISIWQLCKRCEHTWPPTKKTAEEILVCPKCKSPYWRTERKNFAIGKGTPTQK